MVRLSLMDMVLSNWIRNNSKTTIGGKEIEVIQKEPIGQDTCFFFLFARKYLNTRPDGKLADWKKEITNIKCEFSKTKFSFLRPYQKEGITKLNPS